MATRALVTGVTGFVGGQVARALVSRGGWDVRGLVRDARRLRIAGVTPACGDLTAPGTSALEAAARGCDVVFHCAGAVGDKVTWESGRAINVEGARRMATAARDVGVRRFVHVSTVGVYGVRAGTYDERSPRSRQNEPYTDSKIEGEEAIEAVFAARPDALRVLRPAMIYGPGDTGMMPKLIEVLKKRAPMIGNGGTRVGLVHVSDVVASVLAAADHEGAERVFDVLGPDDLTWAELVEQISATFDLPKPRSIPVALAMAMGAVVQTLSAVRLAPRPPPISTFFVRLLAAKREYPAKRVRSDLGVTPRVSVAHGVPEALAELVQAERARVELAASAELARGVSTRGGGPTKPATAAAPPPS